MTLLSRISSTTHSFSLSTISGSGGGKGMLSTYRVFWGQCQLNYIENRMKAAHGGGELEAVCALSDLLDYGERA